MLSAHRGAGSFRYDAAVGSWLHRIVVNACLDRLRRAKSHRTAPLEDVYPVADRTAQVETAMVVQHALMRLPLEQRATIVAVDMQGYSIADTASAARRRRGHGQEPMRPCPGAACPAARPSGCRRRHHTRPPRRSALTPLVRTGREPSVWA